MTSSVAQGSVIDLGEKEINQHGFCYSKNPIALLRTMVESIDVQAKRRTSDKKLRQMARQGA